MGAVLAEALQLEKDEVPVPDEVKAEAAIAARSATGIEEVAPFAKNSVFSCPDCGGVLFEVNNESSINHFRCHTGHSYSQDDLLLKQNHGIESTLWVALRFMEERKTLLRQMEQQNLKRGYQLAATGYRENAEEMQVHIDRLKQALFASQQQKAR